MKLKPLSCSISFILCNLYGTAQADDTIFNFGTMHLNNHIKEAAAPPPAPTGPQQLFYYPTTNGNTCSYAVPCALPANPKDDQSTIDALGAIVASWDVAYVSDFV